MGWGNPTPMAQLKRDARELAKLRRQDAKIRELITDARKVSPSPTMSVYVIDLERVLGLTEAESPRKTGSNG